jgi:hypothetical protein
LINEALPKTIRNGKPQGFSRIQTQCERHAATLAWSTTTLQKFVQNGSQKSRTAVGQRMIDGGPLAELIKVLKLILPGEAEQLSNSPRGQSPSAVSHHSTTSNGIDKRK